jgi:hypothetical protein
MLKNTIGKTKNKLMKTMVTHPRLTMFGIRLAITLGIGAAIGLTEFHQLNAYAIPDLGQQHCIGC